MAEHGLRSLSTADTFYQRSNAPGDNPYWRGPIWININYLALKALYAYKGSVYAGDREDVRSVAVFDANRARCRSVYGRLRSNVVRTILSSYSSTGFFWEQYNGEIYFLSIYLSIYTFYHRMIFPNITIYRCHRRGHAWAPILRLDDARPHYNGGEVLA